MNKGVAVNNNGTKDKNGGVVVNNKTTSTTQKNHHQQQQQPPPKTLQEIYEHGDVNSGIVDKTTDEMIRERNVCVEMFKIERDMQLAGNTFIDSSLTESILTVLCKFTDSKLDESDRRLEILMNLYYYEVHRRNVFSNIKDTFDQQKIQFENIKNEMYLKYNESYKNYMEIDSNIKGVIDYSPQTLVSHCGLQKKTIPLEYDFFNGVIASITKLPDELLSTKHNDTDYSIDPNVKIFDSVFGKTMPVATTATTTTTTTPQKTSGVGQIQKNVILYFYFVT
jgi:hypothetical protein